MKKIDIILPVYNEAEVIYEFTQVLFETINQLKNKYHFQVIYVLDKSSDNTSEVLKRICREFPNTKLIQLSRRFGHQMSLVAGMDHCDGDAVIMMDSDLQHPPSVIPNLLMKFEENFDVVHTKRTYNQEVSFSRKISSRVFYHFIQKISEVYISEHAADFRLISKRVLKVFQTQIREQNQFLRGLFHWVGFNQCYIYFKAESRASGASKYNLKRLITFALTGVVSFSKVPLKWSITMGFIIALLSFVYGIYLVFEYYMSNTSPSGWTTLIVVILFSMGIQFMFMGILGEYIGAIFDESKRRPLYIVEEVFEGN